MVNPDALIWRLSPLWTERPLAARISGSDGAVARHAVPIRDHDADHTIGL
jgi:hypothetical protein